VAGRVDSITAPALEQEVAAIGSEAVTDVDFDFSELDYISSSGLRVLVMCRKKFSGGRVRILDASEDVRSILLMTGMDSLFELTESDAAHAEMAPDTPSGPLSFREIFRRKAAALPDRAVMTFRGASYTWAAIDRLSDALAAEMAAAGVGRLTHVGICGLNSANWIIAFAAVQKLGGIAVFLNFMLKPAELAQFLRIGGVTYLCAGDIPAMREDPDYLRQVLSDPAARAVTGVCDISSRRNFAASAVSPAPVVLADIEVDPDDPAIMIFTSGTTSLPKGVLFSSLHMMDVAEHAAHLLGLTEADEICVAIPLFHIFSAVANLFAAITSDSTLHLPDSPRSADLIACVAQYRCTILHGVPTTFLALVSHPDFASGDLTSLRMGYVGGAPITPAQLTKVRQALPAMDLGVGYGMTELGIAAATRPHDTDEHILKTVGRPLLENVQVHTISPETGRMCAGGEEGELVFKSRDQMVCYYRLPIDQQPIDEEGWLHTGDYGFVDEDGYIHLTGRIKDLIIRNGENIAPREVMEALCRHSAVADAVVVGVPSDFRGEEVGAGLILHEGAEVSDDELRAFLKDKLSDFKIPVVFARYEAWPLLPNGKPDMRRLKTEIAAAFTAQESRV